MNSSFKRLTKAIMGILLAAAVVSFSAVPAFAAKDGGKEIRGIELMNAKKSKSGKGWKWDAKTNTLTLNGLNLKSSEAGITLPDKSCTVKLKGKNKITLATESSKQIYCISSDGSITFTGNGSLECVSSNLRGSAGGIKAENIILNADGKIACEQSCSGTGNVIRCIDAEKAFTMKKGSLVITGSDVSESKTLSSRAISCKSCTIEKKASADITIKANSAAEGIYAYGDKADGVLKCSGKLTSVVNSKKSSAVGINAEKAIITGKLDLTQNDLGFGCGVKTASGLEISGAEIKNLSYSRQAQKLRNVDETLPDNAYTGGIYSSGALTVSDSRLEITAESTAKITCFGILSSSGMSFKDSRLSISAKSFQHNGFGILGMEGGQKSSVVKLDGCNGKIYGNSVCVMVPFNIEVKNCDPGPHKVNPAEVDGHTYYSFSKTLDTKFAYEDGYKLDTLTLIKK